MRTIKFRCTYSNGKDWLKKDFTLIELMNGECFDYLSDQPFYKNYRMKDSYQFTGLTDKNGVEIYEGDIVNFGNNNNVEVKFDNGCFNVFDEPLGWDFTPDHDNDYMPIKSDLRYCEVIGNIYEN